MYRFTESGAILRESDGAQIPCDELNRDYRAIIASGVEIAPYVAPPKPPKRLTLEQLEDLVDFLMVPPEPETPPLGYADEAEPEPYTPDFTLIPEQLARFAEADEDPTAFRNRLKSFWQRFGIEDGKNFPGGGEPLSGDEKIQMREIDILLNSDEGKTARLHDWLFAD